MRYTNPVITGFYPDPSVCQAEGKYYLVSSSFQYFPGVPLFESADLVNWKQIGHVLTRPSQVELAHVPSSGGVFAPAIRYYRGRFYMVTTNATTQRNFYVWTDDIRSPWSEPVTVEQGGIDPSLLFDGDRVYFISNGEDDQGRSGITQCEIDIATGRKLTPSRRIWQGTGGRYLEAPHMYRIGEWYYLLAAEGGTEYGHMVVCARSRDPWGPFESCPHNPILTNRNKAPGVIQGIGHGDLVQGPDGGWHILTLGFRQIGLWEPYHTLGREVFLTPVRFGEDGWPYCGNDGTTEEAYEMAGDFAQERKRVYTFENTDAALDWCFLRRPDMENYDFFPGGLALRGSAVPLDEAGSPTFAALRQKGFDFVLSVDVDAEGGEAGVTAYMCENEHYDLALRQRPDGWEAALKLNIGGVRHTQAALPLPAGRARLIIRADSMTYKFYVNQDGTERPLGVGRAKYLSSEVAGGFTGVMLGLYAVGEDRAVFRDLRIEYFS